MFNKNIILLRKRENITQEDLAKTLKVSRQTISKWEKGEVVPDSYNLIEISKYFSIKVQDLIMTDLSEIEEVKSFEVELPEKVDIEIKKETQIDELTDSQDNQILKIKSSKKKIILILVLIVGLVSIIYIYKDQLFGSNSEVIKDEPTQEPEETLIDYSKLLSAGREFSVYIDENGSVIGYGDNTYNQIDFDNWSDIIQVSAGGFHTLGLKSDGTVLAVGYNNLGQTNVSSWTNIVQLSGGRYHSLGLKEDGTVVCVGENEYGACDVSTWSDITQVSAGRYNSYGLKSDGTVVSTSSNEYGQANIMSWNDIKQISSGTYQVLGLRNDGTVVCAGGQKSDGACNVSSWTDIKQVVGAGYHSIGLKNDGTVVAVGNNEKGQLNVSEWKDIVAISGGRYHTIGLTEDNTFLSLGLDGNENVITGKDDNNQDDSDNESSSDNQTEIKTGKIEYRNIGDNDTSIYLIGESGNSIKNAKYDTLDFRFSFSSTKKNTLLKIRTIDGYEYVKQFYYNNVNDDSKGNYLYEEILKVMRVDYNSKVNQVLTFSIAEIIDDKDNKKGYTNWIDLGEKFIAKNDFDKLFMQYGSLEIRYASELFTLYPGRFDISRFKSGADLDLSMGYDYAYMLYNDENHEFGGEILYLSDLLSNNKNRIAWGTIFPDDFELNKTFYACNSVYSLKEESMSPLISNCIPFSFQTIKFGLNEFGTTMPYGFVKFSYARAWMKTKADSGFKVNIQIPDQDIDYDFEQQIVPINGYYEVNIIDEIKDKLTLSDSLPEEFKVYVKVVAKGVGSYLSSDPYEFVLTLKKSDFE